MPYRIELLPRAIDHLDELRPFDRNPILDEIEEQLTHDPTKQTRRKKILEDAGRARARPVRQLRVGDYHVFYDVDEPHQLVSIHAVLYKGRKTTGEIL